MTRRWAHLFGVGGHHITHHHARDAPHDTTDHTEEETILTVEP